MPPVATGSTAASAPDEVRVGHVPPGPKSLANLEKVQQRIGRTNYAGLYGITLCHGHGSYVRDVDGNSYLDCLTGGSANVLGYGRGDVLEAYTKAAQAIQHTCLLYTPNLPVVDLAQRLIQITPGDFEKRVIFGVSGSDATGGTLQIMRRYTGKLSVIHFRDAYHGSTGLSQQASGFPTLKQGIYRPSIEFISVDFPTDREASDRVLKEIETHLNTGRVGGLIAEVIQGDGGVKVPRPDFFPRLRELLTHYEALLIVDEVQSGMGRSGRWWAIEHEGVLPDLLATAKGLSAGYAPISAVVGREEVVNALDPAQELFTYGGHPPSAAAALRCIQAIEEEALVENAAKRGAQLLTGLRGIQHDYPEILVDARGRGLMLGLEVRVDDFPWRAKVFATRGVELGVYFGYFGSRNQVIRIAPPLVIGEREVETILNTVQRVADEMQTGKVPPITYENTLRYGIGL